jgi:DNA polymerase elongation subunit (family B)
MATITKKQTHLIGKYFRLFDFQIYDNSPKQKISDNSSTSSGSDESRHYVKCSDIRFMIQMFGLNELGETCCLYINDYNPFFYIKVGDLWEDHHAQDLLTYFKTHKDLRYVSSAILSAKLVEHHKLYGFSGGKKYKFVLLTFANLQAMNRVKNLWYKYNEQTNERFRTNLKFMGSHLELYESNIPPLLRYFHINNISPSGWVFVKTNRCIKPLIKSTTCDYEYICGLKNVLPAPDREVRVPYKICSFDIEASSSHGDFPVPIKTYKRLATNIVDIFQKQAAHFGDDKVKSEKVLTKIILTAFGYDRLDDVDIVYPVEQPTKETVKRLIAHLLKTDLSDPNYTDVADKSGIANTIESMFEKMKEANQQHVNVEIEEDSDSDVEMEEADEYSSNPTWKKKETAKHPIKKSTIVDMLLNANYNREEKIQMTNDKLCRTFPKVEGDKVTFIGSTFLRYGETSPYLNHCLVLGSCASVEGTVIESVDEEVDLLVGWTRLIQEENPDIIIGYNIFGFDYEFMFRRAQELHCEREFFGLSRKIGELSAKEIIDKVTNQTTGYEIENTKIAIASGEYDLRYFNMSGRLQIDMFAYFRRDFNLSSYKLDDVAGQFISDDVKKIDFTEDGNTRLYSSNLAGLNKDDFIHIEITGFSSDYYNGGQKFRVLSIENGVEIEEEYKGKIQKKSYNVITIAGHHDISSVAMKKSIKWGMAKDDVTPQDIFRLSKGSAEDRAIVAKYCIQDCNLVHHLMNKIDVITGYIEMSRICSVPISFLVFRGQGVKLTSYVAKKCREKNTLMPDLEKAKSGDGYEGAIVLPPKCSMYMDNPVACVDYSSLYPSSMISQNYSHDSKVWTKEYDLQGNLIRETGEKDQSGKYIYDNLPGYEYIHIEFDTYKYLRNPLRPASKEVKTKVGKMVCCWAQLPNNQKSIMPSILEELLKARADTRKMIKSEKDPFMQNILDKRQLGYKVTANSLYGQCGARTSTFYEKDVAASTTATGRMMITYGKRIIEEVYGDLVYDTKCHGPVKCKAEYVYGDTDSVFFTFNLENPETGEKIRGKPALEMTIEIAQDAADLCTRYLKPPMALTYEKTLMPFILLSKKRYVGMLYEEDPNKGKLKFMGLVLKRRDNCDLVKDIYGGVLNILMKESETIQSAIDFLGRSLQDLIDGKVPMEKLMITKALRSDYKNPQQIAHRVLADRMGKRDPGNKPKPGDRIKYVYIVNHDRKALQGDKIETPEYITENKIPIDYTHYITNQLMKPLQQLFGLALTQIWEYQKKHTLIRTFHKDMAALEKENPNMETFMKKKEKYCSAKIKTILFDKFLQKIFNQQNGIQTLFECFRKK